MTKKVQKQKTEDIVRKIKGVVALRKALVNSRLKNIELKELINRHKRLCRGTYYE
jgi:hypothetical protein